MENNLKRGLYHYIHENGASQAEIHARSAMPFIVHESELPRMTVMPLSLPLSGKTENIINDYDSLDHIEEPSNTLLVTKEFDTHIYDALSIGMGVVYTNGQDRETLHQFLDAAQTPPHKIRLDEIVEQFYQPGEVHFVGITGGPASGKSTISEQLHQVGERLGINCAPISIDYFHLYDRATKKQMFTDPNITEEERRERMMYRNWFNFALMSNVFDTLRAKAPVSLQGVYNLETGKHDGKLELDQPKNGGLYIVEGVEVHRHGLRREGGHFEELFTVRTHPRERIQRIMQRDNGKRSPDEIQRRLAIDQMAWYDSFPSVQKTTTHVIYSPPNFGELSTIPVLPLV